MVTDIPGVLFKLIIPGAISLACLTAIAAPVNYDESIDGDLLGGANQLGTLESGVNKVTGSISGSADSGDRWDLVLPPGHEIHQINYSISNFSAVTSGDRGIFVFSPGNFVPASLTADGVFSWSAGLPFASPLTIDDYFFMRSFQQSGEEVSYDYVVDIHVQQIGTVDTISTDTIGNFELLPGDTLIITNGATLTGDVIVNGGTLVLEDGAIIDGNILGTDGGDIVLKEAAMVSGNIEHTAGTLLLTGGATVGGDAIRVNTQCLTIESGATILGELALVNPGPVSVSDSVVGDGVLIDITGAGIHQSSNVSISGSTVTGNIVIDITGAGLITKDFTFGVSDSSVSGSLRVSAEDTTLEGLNLVSLNTTTNNVLIDITGAGVYTDVNLTDTGARQNILIDITGAGVQADSVVTLANVESGNNILIDITGAGLTRSADITGGNVGNQMQIKGGSVVSVTDAQITKHLKIKQSDFSAVTGNTIGKHLMIQGGNCVAGANQVGGKVIGC